MHAGLACGFTGLPAISYSSKLNAEWAFLTMLRDRGRAAADEFLMAHHDDLGQRSSLELDTLLEGT